MTEGFVRVCAATPQIKVAACRGNADAIIKAVKEISSAGAALAVFPELCICGYTCGDLFNQTALIEACMRETERICRETEREDILFFVGVPVHTGGALYNCAAAICGGKILALIPKTYLAEYGEFYEKRHFAAAPKETSMVTFCGQKVPFGTKIILTCRENEHFSVAAELCEDLWTPVNPSSSHAMAGATVIVNLSCSDETVGKALYREDLVRMQSAKCVCGYVYADSGDGESTTDMVFAGHNIICENGDMLAESRLFENACVYSEIDTEKLAFERQRLSGSFFEGASRDGYTYIDFSVKKKLSDITRTYSPHPFVPSEKEALDGRTSVILDIQSRGLEKRLRHTGARTAVIGISGGLDSALALLVTHRAFLSCGTDVKNIICVTMPCFGTSGKTLENSKRLAASLGCTLKVVEIGDAVTRHFGDIDHDPSKRDVTYENSQARIRTLVLMDIANETGGIVIGTGDMSELALGWATYNGDHMSMYAVNSSVPKTLVKHLIAFEARRIGGETWEVLESILGTEISPELLPPGEDGKISQKTEDIIGPYELHDFFLYYFVRWGFSPKKIAYLAGKAFAGKYGKDEIDRWLRVFLKRFFSQQFKRSCIPDGVKVGSVTLSPRADWRMPSDAECSEWLDGIV